MDMARKTRRSNSQQIIVFSADTALGWRALSRCSVAEYHRRLARGEVRPVHDGFGRLIGCQPIKRTDQSIPSRPSAVCLTVSEMVLFAGQAFKDGRSRTARMTEQQRLQRASRTHPRTGKFLAPEDAIERVTEKVRMQTVSGNLADGGKDRAVRAYPRPE
jgi:hypothetical protein